MSAPSSLSHASGSQTDLPEVNDAASPGRLASGDRIGRFLVVDTLGSGAMGLVLRAYDPRLDRTIALKVIHPDRAGRSRVARARLLAEARALARLAHPNVVSVFEVDTAGDIDYVAMELVDGIDLHQWLRERTRGWTEVADVFAAIADGLAAVHAAGLVHRDVKPANILVGRDGRVRVGDFGIAASGPVDRSGDGTGGPSGMHSTGGGESGIAERTALTEDGRVVGTPAYMAPEQHYGQLLGAAADQFAFCVSLFEALYGTRPFIGPSSTLAAAKRTPPRAPPSGVAPRWLFDAVVRGLAPTAAGRHASMTALAAVLRSHRARRRNTIAIAGSVAALGVTAALWSTRQTPCTDSATRLGGAYSASVRASILEAAGRDTRPFAAEAGRDSTARLDAYAASWTAMHREACEATWVRHEQSEALLDRRMACLAQRRDALAGASTILQSDGAMDRAFEVVGRLPAVATCGDTEALEGFAVPDDPALRAAVDEQRGVIARARAAYDAARYDEAFEATEALVPLARGLGHEPLLAEALVLYGDVLEIRGDPNGAHAALGESLWTALANGADTTATEAATSLVWLESEQRRDFAAAALWTSALGAALRRAGSPPSLTARASVVIGASHTNAGRYQDAIAELERGLALIVDDPQEAYTAHALRVNMANALSSRGDGRQALELLSAELDGLTTMFGPDHPKVNRVRWLVADAASEAGEDARAVALSEQAVESLVRVHGPDHPLVASALGSQAFALARVDRQREAIALYRRAAAVFERAGDRYFLAVMLGNMGGHLEQQGAFDAAAVALDRALALHLEIHGEDHPDMVLPLVARSEVWIDQGRLDTAEVLLRRADAVATARLQPHARERVIAKQALANVVRGQGRAEEAVTLAREAVAIASASDDLRPTDLRQAHADLGLALAAAGRDEEALAEFDTAGAAEDLKWSAEYTAELTRARDGAMQRRRSPAVP